MLTEAWLCIEDCQAMVASWALAFDVGAPIVMYRCLD